MHSHFPLLPSLPSALFPYRYPTPSRFTLPFLFPKEVNKKLRYSGKKFKECAQLHRNKQTQTYTDSEQNTFYPYASLDWHNVLDLLHRLSVRYLLRTRER